MDEIRQAAWTMVTEAGAHRELANRARKVLGWNRFSERQACARLSQMLNPQDPHQLPADLLPTLIDICVGMGVEDRVGPILLRAAMRAEDRRGPLRAAPREQDKRATG